MAKQPGLVIDIRPGEGLAVSGPAQVQLIHKSGQFARLRVVAPADTKIERQPPLAEALRDASMARSEPS